MRRAIHPPTHYSLFVALTANEEDRLANGSASVGSVVVTLEAREKLVIGAFVRAAAAVDGEWEYWEGEFGPSELEAHVSEGNA